MVFAQNVITMLIVLVIIFAIVMKDTLVKVVNITIKRSTIQFNKQLKLLKNLNQLNILIQQKTYFKPMKAIKTYFKMVL